MKFQLLRLLTCGIAASTAWDIGQGSTEFTAEWKKDYAMAVTEVSKRHPRKDPTTCTHRAATPSSSNLPHPIVPTPSLTAHPPHRATRSTAPPAPPRPPQSLIPRSKGSIASFQPPMPLPPTSAPSACPHLTLSAAPFKEWNDPALQWPGLAAKGPPPADGTALTLPAATVIVVRAGMLTGTGTSPYGRITVPSGSRLVFDDPGPDPAAPLSLHTLGLNINGAVEAGSPTCRLQGRLEITLHGQAGGEDATTSDRAALAATAAVDPAIKGIAVNSVAGARLDLHGKLYHPTWTRLAAHIPGKTQKETTAPDIRNRVLLLQDCVNWPDGVRGHRCAFKCCDTRNEDMFIDTSAPPTCISLHVCALITAHVSSALLLCSFKQLAYLSPTPHSYLAHSSTIYPHPPSSALTHTSTTHPHSLSPTLLHPHPTLTPPAPHPHPTRSHPTAQGEIIVTTSHVKDTRGYNFNEKATIAVGGAKCVSVDGHSYGQVTLTTALEHYHHAGEREYQCEVRVCNNTMRGSGSTSAR
jgi:hypothetical protein